MPENMYLINQSDIYELKDKLRKAEDSIVDILDGISMVYNSLQALQRKIAKIDFSIEGLREDVEGIENYKEVHSMEKDEE